MPDDSPPRDDTPDSEETELSGAGTLRALGGPVQALAFAGLGLLTLAFFYTLYAASAFFLPVVIALVLNFLLSPLVRSLHRLHIPIPLGAALVLVSLLGVTALALYHLSGPASSWVEQAPTALRQAEYNLRGLTESVGKVEEATEQLENLTGGDQDETVQVEQTTMSDALLSQTQQFAISAAVVFFLLYFLLASGDLFLRKLVHVLPMLRRKRIAVQIAHSIENDLSRYLFTYAMINTALGTVVGFGFYLLGLPDPVLWGLMVAVLNFVPYLGPLVGVSIIGIVAFVSFESTVRALAAPALYFTINALEGNLVTPLVMGRRLQLNPVAIFLSLTFWGWIWGLAGALLAVPLLVALKIICDNVATLAPLGEFLGR